MRIGIDARFLGPEGTGIGRYVENLIKNLEIVDQENQYFIFLRSSNYHLYQPKAPNFEKVKADAKWYSLKEQLILPAVLNREKLDLVHFPHFNIPLLYRGKFVVTIHDLTKSLFGDRASSTRSLPIFLAKQNAYKITINQAMARSKKILVPSEFVKKELVKSFDLTNEKIRVTYEGAEEFYDPKFVVSEGKTRELFNKYSLSEPYIIFVGNTFPYKNVDVILEALTKLPTELKFVCVSPRNRFLEKLIASAGHLGIKNRLTTPGYLSDSDLKVLFKKAVAFVFPSLSEGFGLPGLEAMGVGCPVISSDKTSLPEVYGEAALYFKPDSSKELVGKIEQIMKDENLKAAQVKKGFEQVKKYSWKKLAEETLEVYKEVNN